MADELQPITPRTEPKVSLEDCLANGWKTMVNRFWALIVVLGAVYTYPLLVGMLSLLIFLLMPASMGRHIIMALLGLTSSLLTIFVVFGTYNLQLAALEGEKLSSKTVFAKCTYHQLWNYSLCMFMTGFFTFLGYCFFIFPGIYLQMSLQFAPFFISEKDCGPIEALKASWAITEDSRLNLFYLWVVCGFIEWIGGMIFFVGVIPAKLNTMMVKAYAYRALLNATDPAKLPYERNLLEAHLR